MRSKGGGSRLIPIWARGGSRRREGEGKAATVAHFSYYRFLAWMDYKKERREKGGDLGKLFSDSTPTTTWSWGGGERGGGRVLDDLR